MPPGAPRPPSVSPASQWPSPREGPRLAAGPRWGLLKLQLFLIYRSGGHSILQTNNRQLRDNKHYLQNTGKRPTIYMQENSSYNRGNGSVLVKAPQDPPPLKTVQKIGHPGTADFLYSFEGGGPPPSKVYKTPSKGGP